MDPVAAWDRTPGELNEYIKAYAERMERQSYMYYNLAASIAGLIFNKRKPEPWECFPGWIKPKVVEMSDEELYQSVLAWCGMGDAAT